MPIRLLRTTETDKLEFDFVQESQLRKKTKSQDEPHADTAPESEKTFTYAILSHRWRSEEIEYEDRHSTNRMRRKKGWQKLLELKRIARQDGYTHVWIDTCCIDKTNSTELTEALNSMYRWYQLADICYAYLDDVLEAPYNEIDPPQSTYEVASHTGTGHTKKQATDEFDLGYVTTTVCELDADDIGEEAIELLNVQPWTKTDPVHSHFRDSEWFTRGWTLQELLAPSRLVFFTARWEMIGTVPQLLDHVVAATGIDRGLLNGSHNISSYSIAQIFSWAALRKTTRIEDRAYSLIGILNIGLPIIYGEGQNSLQRLQQALIEQRPDTTILAWSTDRTEEVPQAEHQILAAKLEYFRDCGQIISISSRATQRLNFTNGTMDLIGPVVKASTALVEIGSRHLIIGRYQHDGTRLRLLRLRPDKSANASKNTSSLSVYTMLPDGPRLEDGCLFGPARDYSSESLRILSTSHIMQEDTTKGLEVVFCDGHIGPLPIKVIAGYPEQFWDQEQHCMTILRQEDEVLLTRSHGNIKLRVGSDAIIYLAVRRLDDGLSIHFDSWPIRVLSWLSRRLAQSPKRARRRATGFCRHCIIEAWIVENEMVALDGARVKLQTISFAKGTIPMLRIIAIPLGFFLSLVLIWPAAGVLTWQYYFIVGLPLWTVINYYDISGSFLFMLLWPLIVTIIVVLAIGARSAEEWSFAWFKDWTREWRHLRAYEYARTTGRTMASVKHVTKLLWILLRPIHVQTASLVSIILCILLWKVLKQALEILAAADEETLNLSSPMIALVYAMLGLRIFVCLVAFCCSYTNLDLTRCLLAVPVTAILITFATRANTILSSPTSLWAFRCIETLDSIYFIDSEYYSIELPTSASCSILLSAMQVLWLVVLFTLCDGIVALITFPFTRDLESPYRFVLRKHRDWRGLRQHVRSDRAYLPVGRVSGCQ